MSRAQTDTQFLELQQHVSRAYETKPFYRALYDAAGVHPNDLRTRDDLQLLPTINKALILADQEKTPPFGSMNVQRDDLARVNLIASCLYMCLSHEDQLAVTGMFQEMFEVMGMKRGDLVDIASAYHWVSGGTQMDAAVRALGAAVVPGGPGQSQQRVRVLKETGATVLQAFTGYAEELGQRFDQYGIDAARDLKVRLLIIGGELRDRAAKSRLESRWGGARAREYYGVSEAGILAAECFENGDGMHISRKCVVEVIDPSTGKVVSPGEAGEVVTTELVRKTQPFIRYRTGDITEGLRYEQCSCGRSSVRLGRILGRSAEIPRIKGLFIAPSMIDRAVRERQGLGRWRAILERRGTSDRVTLQAEWDEAGEPKEIASTGLVRGLKETVGITFDIEFVPVGSIDPTAPRIDDRRQFS